MTLSFVSMEDIVKKSGQMNHIGHVGVVQTMMDSIVNISKVRLF